MTTIEQAEVRFVELMAELFQLDEAERLDFGFYRVIRHHNQEVKEFLGQVIEKNGSKTLEGGKLSEMLATAFRKADDEEAAGDRLRLKEIEGEFGIRPGMNDQEQRDLLDQAERFPAFKSKVDEYRSLQEQLRASENVGTDRREVLNRLYQFFSRHYQDGDFIVERRYGRDGSRYIRSTGEDTEFHWATEDMYYIKSGDTFTDFTVRLSNGERIVFSVEPDDLQKTRASLKPTDKAHYEIDAVTKAEDGRYIVLLKYLKGAQSNKQKDDVVKAIQAHINADEAELKRWLNHFVARNQSDFFIHKRLGAALREDLDIFLKTEVLNVDQLLKDSDLPRRLIRVGRIVREIGQQIIDFLAVLEDFQKSLWEKKKLVFTTRYVITLDRIATLAGEDWLIAHLPQIIAAQRTEWKELGLGDFASMDDCREVTQGDLATPSVERWLPLPIDTRNLETSFRFDLLSRVKEIDYELDGVLINSDNWQALNLVSQRYSGEVGCIYTDPPYNAPYSLVAYKNSYKHASWVALMEDRLAKAHALLEHDAAMFIAIDDWEYVRLMNLLRTKFGGHSHDTVVVNHHPQGSGGDNISRTHEYMICSTPKGSAILHNTDTEEGHEERPFMRSGTGENNFRDKRHRSFYALLVNNAGKVVGAEKFPEKNESCYPREDTEDGLRRVYPLGGDDKKVERVWRLSFASGKKAAEAGRLKISPRGAVYQIIDRSTKRSPVFSNWTDKRYNAGTYGSDIIKDMFGSSEAFSYPKSINTVKDALVTALNSKPETYVLDFFGGSGTTPHAVLELNKERQASDFGRLKFIAFEVNRYFDPVIVNRVKKAGASINWSGGKSISLNGPGLFMRIQEIEQYEDTLENLALLETKAQAAMGFEDLAFSIQYRLDREARRLFQSVDHFRSPFGYSIKCAQGGGEAVDRDVDLVESLIYLLGLDVTRIYREDQGVVVTGTDRRNRSVTVLFRECDREGNEEWCNAKMVEHPADRFLTNAMPELAFDGCERFEAIEAVFATQFGGR